MAAAVAGLAAAGLLHYLPPESYGFYPACPIRQFTGISCPGCGATRALAALARGQISIALSYNAFILALIPAALLAAFSRPPARLQRPIFLSLLAAAGAFTLLRNLGVIPFPD